jgi:hypothetical protein
MLHDNGDRGGAGGGGGGGGVLGNDSSFHQFLKLCISSACQETPSSFRNPKLICLFQKKKKKFTSCPIVSQKFSSRILKSHFFKIHFNPYPANVENMVSS